MRSILRFALLALVLLLVAAVSALTAMRFAIHGREATVPKLIGLSPNEARTAAASNGLLLNIENRFYSAEVPQGRIMSQIPPAGERVRRGWEVRVAESLGPQRHVIPNVVGESARAAEINLRRRGLDVGTIASVALPEQPPDVVVAQSPPPNAGAASPKVDLLVATAEAPAEFVMPDLTGRHVAEAIRTVEAAGLRLGKVEDPGTSGGSTIVHQAPAAGQKVTAGAVVSFTVAK